MKKLKHLFWTSFYVLFKRLEKYDEIWYNKIKNNLLFLETMLCIEIWGSAFVEAFDGIP